MTRSKQKQVKRHKLRQTVVGLALAVVTMCGLFSILTPRAEASMEYYLDKVVEWGVMRGDINGNLNPNRQITRAEFVTMVNRAYGYKDMGPNPFSDVQSKHWFYEDVCIANKVGYFKGTTPTTASPYSKLTREQAAVIIGRNMMLEQGTGEALGFSDSRKLGDWSRHMIESVSKEGIITGYSDGSFRPKNFVTRGQVAAMLVRAVGTPVQHSGEQSLGGVYGNVTITTPGVTLKDTTIYGDLYVTGGVGLGNVVLENVKVMGKIVVSGTGESEKGEHSVVLRNVTAEELVMDSLAQQFVTLKSEGLTQIDKVNVRTGAYLEDLTEEAYGLKNIVLDGPDGTKFQVAGNIKDVTMKTTKGELTLAQGVAGSITVDEIAKDSILNIADKATANKVNLDAATKVTGTGDVGHMNVNAPGSSSTMLPDTIVVRPGIEADIHGETMDNVAAQQSSEDPRLLSGYPVAKNVSPKTADGVFKTNKKGTIYWAVTSLMDGSASEEELLKPPAYSNKIIANGTVKADAADKEFVEKISKLTSDGSYYLSAMLVDNRGKHSPVKIDAFTTPDDSVPNFASGYPYAIIADGKDKEQILQVMSMPTKNCLMYYALLPKGSTAPKPADFKANAVTGNLGYGVVEVQKNTPYLVSRVNTVTLREETDYDLYLWLTDANGVKSSPVKKLQVKTLDRTAPQIIHLDTIEENTTSVTLNFALDEPGTFYWAVVKEGADFYLNKDPNFPHTEQGKAQVQTGLNSLKHGKAVASKGATDVKFTISGLKAQTAYDVYYVAVDKANNTNVYHESIKLPYAIHTKDDEGPTVYQEFTKDGSSDTKLMPYPDTDIHLVFSENVRRKPTRDMSEEEAKKSLMELQKGSSKEDWAKIVREYVKLYAGNTADPVKERTVDNENEKDLDWVVDYRNVTMEWDESGTGEVIMNFPYKEDPVTGKVSKDSALNLVGGVTYHFELNSIEDMAGNRLKNSVRVITSLPPFTTISALVLLNDPVVDAPAEYKPDGQNTWYFDMTFTADPVSHSTMPETVLWDMVIWSKTSVKFNLYQRERGSGDSWARVGNTSASISAQADGRELGVSIGTALLQEKFQPVRDMTKMDYAIEILSVDSDDQRENWNVPVELGVTFLTGSWKALHDASTVLVNSGYYEDVVGSEKNNMKTTDISSPLKYHVRNNFVDKKAPNFAEGFPTQEVGETVVNFDVALDRINSQFYYVVAPVGRIVTVVNDPADKKDKTVVLEIKPNDQQKDSKILWEKLPTGGNELDYKPMIASAPKRDYVVNYHSTSPNDPVKFGRGKYNGSVVSVDLTGLMPKTEYIAYFVLQGQSQETFSQVHCFRFKTDDVDIPWIDLQQRSPNALLTTTANANVDWVLISSTSVGNNILGEKLLDRLQDQSKKDALTAAAAKDTRLQGITVIQALCMDMSSGLGSKSVFDEFADEKLRNAMLSFIRTSTGETFTADSGKAQTLKEVQQSLKFNQDGMSPLTQYYCIATARNSMSDSDEKRSYKAVGNIHLVDSEPPKFQTAMSLDNMAASKKGQYDVPIEEALYGGNKLASSYYYQGVVTLTFDKIPYQVSENGEEKKPLTTALLKKEYTDPLGVVEKMEVKGKSIVIYFKNARKGDTITMLNNGFIGDAYGNTNKKSLQLKFDVKGVYVQGSGEQPGFTAEWVDPKNT